MKKISRISGLKSDIKELNLSHNECKKLIEIISQYREDILIDNFVKRLIFLLQPAEWSRILIYIRKIILKKHVKDYDFLLNSYIFGPSYSASNERSNESGTHQLSSPEYMTSTSPKITSTSDTSQASSFNVADPHTYVLKVDKMLSNGNLGFSIRGGSDYDIGIFISSVDKGSFAEKAGLYFGDRIIEVNGTSFESITHRDAVHLINSYTILNITVEAIGKIPVSKNLRDDNIWLKDENGNMLYESIRSLSISSCRSRKSMRVSNSRNSQCSTNPKLSEQNNPNETEEEAVKRKANGRYLSQEIRNTKIPTRAIPHKPVSNLEIPVIKINSENALTMNTKTPNQSHSNDDNTKLTKGKKERPFDLGINNKKNGNQTGDLIFDEDFDLNAYLQKRSDGTVRRDRERSCHFWSIEDIPNNNSSSYTEEKANTGHTYKSKHSRSLCSNYRDKHIPETIYKHNDRLRTNNNFKPDVTTKASMQGKQTPHHRPVSSQQRKVATFRDLLPEKTIQFLQKENAKGENKKFIKTRKPLEIPKSKDENWTLMKNSEIYNLNTRFSHLNIADPLVSRQNEDSEFSWPDPPHL